MKILKFIKAVLMLSFAASLNASAAPTLTISNGILTGARNVEVMGMFYDVKFVDGSCDSVFNGCNPSTFPFPQYTDALVASQVLLEQVFIDGPLGQFDSRPELTRGCSSTLVCEVLIPFAAWGDHMNTAFSDNHSGATTDRFGATPWPSFRDFTDLSAYTLAVFSVASAPIPEPSTNLLFFIGIAMACFATTRSQRKIVAV